MHQAIHGININYVGANIRLKSNSVMMMSNFDEKQFNNT
jgi:hypothetical protein